MSQSSASVERPHIVFLLSDQHHAGVIGGGGDPYVRTPHMDRLRAEGISLDRCYCASPLSVPSRMALLSTRLPSRTRVFTNSHSLPSDQATFVHALALAGYRTTLCGRMHFVGPDQRHGYQRRLVGDITPVRWGGYKPAYGPLLRGTPGQGRVALERSGPGDSLVLHYDQDVTDGACRYLEQYADDRPLFLTVGWYGPHCPFVCPRELFAYYHERLPLPDVPADFLDAVHPAIRDHLKRRDVLDQPQAWVRACRAAYYGLVEILDRHVGRVLETVDRTLGLDNTLVVYGSDHGDMIGHNRLFWKSTFYEGSVRVPLIFRDPKRLGQASRGRVIPQLASLLDLGPTLQSLVQAPSLPATDGLDLGPALRGEAPIDPDRVVLSQLGGTPRDHASAMVRWRNWKLIRYAGYQRTQLFDLDADPAEQRDLGQDARHADLRQTLDAALARSWNEHEVAAFMHESSRHAGLIHAFDEAAPYQPGPDQWQGREQDNRIEPWP